MEIGGEPRRRWSLEQKLALVEATFQPGASVNGVARRLGVNPGMLFSWRKEFRAQLGFPETPKAKGFAPVMLAPPEASIDQPPPRRHHRGRVTQRCEAEGRPEAQGRWFCRKPGRG